MKAELNHKIKSDFIIQYLGFNIYNYITWWCPIYHGVPTISYMMITIPHMVSKKPLDYMWSPLPTCVVHITPCDFH